jgi:zinc and cadmium transporter
MIELFFASVGIMLASLVGIVAVWNRAGAKIERNIHFLVSFSAGVFAVFAYQVASEALEHSGGLQGLIYIFIGAIVVWVSVKLLPTLHRHGAHEHEPHGEDEHHTHQHLDPRRMIFSDEIHNIGDGIFLAASFAVSSTLGLAAAASIFVHELLQEMSEFFILRDAGYTTRRALTLNFFVSSTILIGSIGGTLLLGAFEALHGPLLGFAAGGVLVVVLHDLIPHSVRESMARGHALQHLMWFMLGVLLMMSAVALMPHTEVESGTALQTVALLG